MGVLRYIKMTFKNDLKQSKFYMLILMLSVILIFNIFNIAFNEEIVKVRSSEYLSISGFGVVIMVVSIMFILFANSYYMEEKFREYAVMSICGNSIRTICEVIIIRNTIVSLICVSLGCVLGVLVSVPIMKGIGAILDIASVTVISKYSLLTTIILMITEMEMVYIINAGKVYGSTINELFHRDRISYIQDKRKHRVFPIIYILLYLLPVLCGIIPISLGDKILMIRYTSIVGLLGIWGAIRYVVPAWMKNYREKQLIIDKCKLIELSNVYSSIQSSGSVIIVLVVAILVSIMLGSGYKAGSLVSTMSFVCYIAIILIMSLTVIYKFIIEAENRKNNFKQLKLLGYTKVKIREIVLKEVVIYYLMLIFLAFPFVLMITLSSVLEGLMSIGVEAVILILYASVFSLTGIISYKLYEKRVV